jgi:hypothetical protein
VGARRASRRGSPIYVFPLALALSDMTNNIFMILVKCQISRK